MALTVGFEREEEFNEEFCRLIALEARQKSGRPVSKRDIRLFKQEGFIARKREIRRIIYTVGAVLVGDTLYVSIEYLNASEQMCDLIKSTFPHERLEVLIPKNWRPDNRATRREAERLNRH